MDSATEVIENEASQNLPRAATGTKWVLLVVSVLSSIFLFALDNTIVADVQPKIVNDLGEIDKLAWISVGFALGAVGVQLFWCVHMNLCLSLY